MGARSTIRSRPSRGAPLAAALALGALLGCAPPDGPCADAVGARVEGPELTGELLADASLPIELRVRAARSLMGAARRDVYAPTVLGEQIRARPEADRRALAEALLEAIDEGLASDSVREGARAKDLLVELAPWLDPRVAPPRLAAWFAGDAERFVGVHPAAAIYAEAPPEWLALLLEAIESPTLPTQVVALLTALHEVPALRAMAVDGLLESEARAHTEAFEDWLAAHLEEAFEDRGRDANPLEVERLVMINRDGLRLRAIEALGPVSDSARVRDRLLERAVDRALDGAVRRSAIAALSEQLTEAEARALLERALDPRESPRVRVVAVNAAGRLEVMAEPAFSAAAEADDVVRYGLLSAALRHSPERYAGRLIADGLPPPPHRLEELRRLGEGLEGRLSAATLELMRGAGEAHVVIVAVAAGAEAGTLVDDRRPVQLAPPAHVQTLGRALTWRPDELGPSAAANEAERMILRALSHDPDGLEGILAGE